MSPRGRVALAALCGAVTLVWGATGHFGSPRVEDPPAPIASSPAESVAANIEVQPAPVPQAIAEDAPPVVASEDPPPAATSEHARQAPPSEDPVAAADPAIAEPVPAPPAPTPGMQLASLGPAEPAETAAKEATPPRETREECSAAAEICVDQYLWTVYARTPKQDSVKVSEKVKVTVTKKGKTRTITKTVTKLVDEDFAWKDPKAAQRAGMPLPDYVIGGMDRSFRLKLYHALRAMDDAGLEPGITSGFRDDYRQAIASGKKAASDSSYHGGSRRGGYGHGLAADLVSVKGETRAERWVSSEALWKWVDAHGAEFGVGRPYLDRDPPHVGPIDGKEYADKRGGRGTKQARSEKKRPASAASNDHRRTKGAGAASPKAAPLVAEPAAPGSQKKRLRRQQAADYPAAGAHVISAPKPRT